MPENPVILIAEETVAHGGTGLELIQTFSRKGGHLRVWLPTIEGARAVAAIGRRLRLDVGPPLQHLDTPTSTTHRGYQLVTYIPAGMLAAALEAMRTPAAMAAQTPELTAGSAELTAGT